MTSVPPILIIAVALAYAVFAVQLGRAIDWKHLDKTPSRALSALIFIFVVLAAGSFLTSILQTTSFMIYVRTGIYVLLGISTWTLVFTNMASFVAGLFDRRD